MQQNSLRFYRCIEYIIRVIKGANAKAKPCDAVLLFLHPVNSVFAMLISLHFIYKDDIKVHKIKVHVSHFHAKVNTMLYCLQEKNKGSIV